ELWLFCLLRRGHILWKRLDPGALRRLPVYLPILLGGVMAIVVATLLIALVAPPNTPDSFTYHLARVMHWMQDASLAPYPTNYISQIIQPPWAEYVALHLHLLSGGDWLDGAVQWFSFVGCIIGVSLIARELGATARGQTFATVFAATIPMAIIQASSTQNDLVVAYWLVCAVFFLFASLKHMQRLKSVKATGAAALWGAGACLGLAILTKATAYIDVFPFLLVFGVYALWRMRWQAWRPVAVIALLALALNAAFFLRNMAWSGNPLGPTEATQAFRNGAYTPAVLLLNILRNLLVEFGTPWLAANATLNRDVYTVFAVLHLNPNDPQATMAHSPTFLLRGDHNLWASDGYTDNPLHMLLTLGGVAVCLSIGALRQRRRLLGYLAALAGAFMLFSSYLRWQAGSDRLMLGLFVLAAPFVGVVIEALSQTLCQTTRQTGHHRMSWTWALPAALGVNVILLVLASSWLLMGQSRPLIGPTSVLNTPRADQYFAAYPAAEPSYVSAAHAIADRGCAQVGFYASGPQDRVGYTHGAPSWEYPLWVLLGDDEHGAVHIEQVGVTNETAPLAAQSPYSAFQPCAVFAIVEPSANSDQFTVSGHLYQRAWQSQPHAGFSNAQIVVYLPEHTQAPVS
ncbi:MAG: hypothetical protein ABI068_16370, partial [Ktedonobacterales bacterium]